MTTGTTVIPFADKLRTAQAANRSLLCVGLDPDPSRFPAAVGNTPESIIAFNRAIIEATSDLACCYKPNLGFYLAYGALGVEALAQVRRDVPAHIPVLLDAKFGDIGITSVGYARAAFETWNVDALTVNPFLGRDALDPFLSYSDRGIFVLAKTSNPGSGLLQDRQLAGGGSVTMAVVNDALTWNAAGNVGLVVGATYPEQLAEVRASASDLPILVPGVGAQQGDLAAAVQVGLDANRAGLLINASRAISYASSGPDFKDAARAAAEALRAQIESARIS
ncbi:MAG TPA: orotidine-5'-phosphate decarboxylase [Thermomicrobiales bacterium]|nr:orotidine-5'-phosphate decarboxylase [Thermomicrobiales bacterium]